MPDSVECSNCGNQNPSDSRFCLNCGTNLITQAAAKTVETMESSIVIDLVTCQQCGAPIKYRGDMKEVIQCNYCQSTNIVYDRVQAMKDMVLGYYGTFGREGNRLVRETKAHKLKLVQNWIEQMKVPSFQNIPDFEDVVLEYLTVKF